LQCYQLFNAHALPIHENNLPLGIVGDWSATSWFANDSFPFVESETEWVFCFNFGAIMAGYCEKKMKKKS
jgi:hypothetical protein